MPLSLWVLLKIKEMLNYHDMLGIEMIPGRLSVNWVEESHAFGYINGKMKRPIRVHDNATFFVKYLVEWSNRHELGDDHQIRRRITTSNHWHHVRMRKYPGNREEKENILTKRKLIIAFALRRFTLTSGTLHWNPSKSWVCIRGRSKSWQRFHFPAIFPAKSLLKKKKKNMFTVRLYFIISQTVHWETDWFRILGIIPAIESAALAMSSSSVVKKKAKSV